jgi:putative hydrolase of the HAD superfamily
MEPTGGRVVRGVRDVVKDLGLAGSEAGRTAIGAWTFDGCIDLLRTFEGVAETVDRMRADYALGVITNGDGKLQRVKWLRLNLGIELVVISAECGFEKPDSRIFAHACSLAGVDACDAVFVGDRLDVDIAGAKGAGLRAVWFNNWGGKLDGLSVPPDAVITSFDELPAVIAEI